MEGVVRVGSIIINLKNVAMIDTDYEVPFGAASTPAIVFFFLPYSGDKNVNAIYFVREKRKEALRELGLEE